MTERHDVNSKQESGSQVNEENHDPDMDKAGCRSLALIFFFVLFFVFTLVMAVTRWIKFARSDPSGFVFVMVVASLGGIGSFFIFRHMDRD